jgi:hypothetical protein
MACVSLLSGGLVDRGAVGLMSGSAPRSSAAPTDHSLIERIARGDESAAAALYDRYAKTLYAVALQIIGDAAESEEAVLDARTSVKDGKFLSAPMGQNHLFPGMAVRMILVGESTGRLEQMLGKIADFYEAEVDTDVKGLASLIEPIVIVLMGLIVGTIVIAMFWPIFDFPDPG